MGGAHGHCQLSQVLAFKRLTRTGRVLSLPLLRSCQLLAMATSKQKILDRVAEHSHNKTLQAEEERLERHWAAVRREQDTLREIWRAQERRKNKLQVLDRVVKLEYIKDLEASAERRKRRLDGPDYMLESWLGAERARNWAARRVQPKVGPCWALLAAPFPGRLRGMKSMDLSLPVFECLLHDPEALDLDPAFDKPLVSGRLEVQTKSPPFCKPLKESFLQGPLDLDHVQEVKHELLECKHELLECKTEEGGGTWVDELEHLLA